MRKRVFLWAAVAVGVFAVASCEIETVNQIINQGLFGEATVIINDGNSTDTLFYQSSVTDNFVKTVDGSDETYVATLDFSANVDLSKSELTFPFLAFQVVDTVAGSYNVDQVLTQELLYNFNFDTLAKIIRDPAGFNIVAIAVSDTAWYISNTGSIVLSNYPSVGHELEGSFNNVGAYYFTESDVDRLNEAIENGAAFNMADYFHPVTITGTFTSRRANLIHSLIEEAFFKGGLCNLK